MLTLGTRESREFELQSKVDKLQRQLLLKEAAHQEKQALLENEVFNLNVKLNETLANLTIECKVVDTIPFQNDIQSSIDEGLMDSFNETEYILTHPQGEILHFPHFK